MDQTLMEKAKALTSKGRWYSDDECWELVQATIAGQITVKHAAQALGSTSSATTAIALVVLRLIRDGYLRVEKIGAQ